MRFPDLDTFVERFAPNVTRGGVFIATRAPRPVGDVFPFEIQISTGQVALAGEGKVIWVKEFDPSQPSKPHGMGVQFLGLAPAAKEVLARMLKAKGALPVTAMRGGSRPHAVVGGGLGGRATGPVRTLVDTNVDLAAEYGLDEAALRRALDRAWGPGGRPTEDDLEALGRADASEPVSLAQALSDLPRILGSKARRRTTGAIRPLESPAVATPEPTLTTPENGVSHATAKSSTEERSQ
jgi:uncharacterized protein (TIGR02266 family)